jgi:hypothetical protein
MKGVRIKPISPTSSRDKAALVCAAQKIRGIHNSTRPNQEHGASAFNLGNDAVICVVPPSSAVVVAGHGC